MRRIPELDGLRGFAAVMVMLTHLGWKRLGFGWAAVDLFFVLSGYLITDIILRNAGSRQFLKMFYARRSLRIWPIYYLVILALTILGTAPRGALPYYLTYTQNLPYYLRPNAGLPFYQSLPDWPELGHAWTLAVEEQFYLLWPAALLLLGGRVIPLALLCLIASISARWAGFSPQILLARSDGLVLGAILASLLSGEDTEAARRSTRRWAALAALAASVLVAMLLAQGRRDIMAFPIQDPLNEIMIACLVSFAVVAAAACHSGHPILSPLRWAPLRYFGTISYGLYLYHFPIYRFFYTLKDYYHIPHGRITPSMMVVSGAMFGVSIAVAAISWHFIEKPILSCKRYFEYKPAPIGDGASEMDREAIVVEAIAPPA